MQLKKKDGANLKYASKRLQDNDDVVLFADNSHKENYNYASERMKIILQKIYKAKAEAYFKAEAEAKAKAKAEAKAKADAKAEAKAKADDSKSQKKTGK